MKCDFDLIGLHINSINFNEIEQFWTWTTYKKNYEQLTMENQEHILKSCKEMMLVEIRKPNPYVCK